MSKPTLETYNFDCVYEIVTFLNGFPFRMAKHQKYIRSQQIEWKLIEWYRKCMTLTTNQNHRTRTHINSFSIVANETDEIWYYCLSTFGNYTFQLRLRVFRLVFLFRSFVWSVTVQTSDPFCSRLIQCKMCFNIISIM